MFGVLTWGERESVSHSLLPWFTLPWPVLRWHVVPVSFSGQHFVLFFSVLVSISCEGSFYVRAPRNSSYSNIVQLTASAIPEPVFPKVPAKIPNSDWTQRSHSHSWNKPWNKGICGLVSLGQSYLNTETEIVPWERFRLLPTKARETDCGSVKVKTVCYLYSPLHFCFSIRLGKSTL